MRRLLTTLLFAAAVAPPAAALGDLAAFAHIQDSCVNVGGLSFGPQGRWPACRVDKGRWFSTIGITDMYQAQYCLGSGGACTERALLLFANRAYTPGAKLLFRRLDPGDTVYADPQVWRTDDGWILALEAQRPGQPAQRSYYRWEDESWQAVDAAAWRRDLARRLAAGLALLEEPHPDLDHMSVQASAQRRTDGATGQVDVDLCIAGSRFVIKALRVNMPGLGQQETADH